ncbi:MULTISPECIES: ParA family protein [Leptospira]|uniref:CobQ/CobB/MinD/ParA nucleotide binding domain protein n=2 Tax=Leptospira interrogans TaxID=173 RepID=A0A0E2D4Y4_LEPIR|nr:MULTISPECIES: ParA family protein [Leptospira]EKR55084.1 CobQ/CobB/MinD/ParA nucleotide binding domain protein [Leptospira interrogans str. UI 12758]EMN34616.1 CobQ/CobB/MinD/ParA nucleotide binding domain protein [Leptospira interrogans serovar Medanensis str. L0448]KGE21911.1 chromosome partitioning protein ParA [Leptospira interrogans serovar Lai]QOI53278.1 ParA family protein [Leptospira interrogans serovar Bataviae]UML82841.1 ParA family protein [Leptospira interrogans]
MGHNIITIANPKGGVSKTTTTGHLSMAIARKKSVLAVDFDQQKDLSKMFFFGETDNFFEMANIFTLLKYETTLSETIRNKYNVDIIVSAPSLQNFQSYASKNIEVITRTKEILRESNHDFVIIDTPGSGSFETTSALLAADIVIIPVIPHRWSLDTLKVFFKNINETMKQTTSTLTSIFILPSIWGNSNRSEQIYKDLYSIPEFLDLLKHQEDGFDLLPKPEILEPIFQSNTVRDRSEFGEPLAEGTQGKISYDNLADKLISFCSQKQPITFSRH